MLYIHSICSFILLVGIALGHESENNQNISYDFKDMIHGMCVGHHHKNDDELKEICNQFPEHFNDILELQSKPPEVMTERYLTGLTGLVTLSDTLTKEQKHSFYRRSYNRAIEAGKDGVEWKWLLGLLIERTDALSLVELEDLMRNTTHEPMKPLIGNAIDRMERRSHSSSRKDGSEPERKINNLARPENDFEKEVGFKWPLILAIAVLVGALGVWGWSKLGSRS